VKAITGSTQATTVASPANYPAATCPTSSPIHVGIPPAHTQLKRPPYHLEEHPHLPAELITDPETTILQRYQLVADHEEIGSENNKRGLGQLPQGLKSVSSLILFNSQENPYKEYSLVDALLFRGRRRVDDVVVEDEENVFDGDILAETDKDEITYRPVHENMRDARAALPSHLVALGNVATNVGFSRKPDGDYQTIAPTALPVAISGLDLPDINPATPAPATDAESATPVPDASAPPAPALFQASPVPPPPGGEMKKGAPPPPPPPGGAMPKAVPPPPGGEMKKGVPPPPPPPMKKGNPPPPPPPMKKAPKAAAAAEPAESGDLFEAIRRGGNLKPAGDKKKGGKKKKGKKGGDDEEAPAEKKAPAPQGPDMFAELVGALMRRRNAFTNPGGPGPKKSAAKDEENGSDEDVGGDDAPGGMTSPHLNFEQEWD